MPGWPAPAPLPWTSLPPRPAAPPPPQLGFPAWSCRAGDAWAGAGAGVWRTALEACLAAGWAELAEPFEHAEPSSLWLGCCPEPEPAAEPCGADPSTPDGPQGDGPAAEPEHVAVPLPATGRAGPISEWLAQLDVWGRPLASVGEEPGRATAAAADAAEDPFHDDWSGW